MVFFDFDQLDIAEELAQTRGHFFDYDALQVASRQSHVLLYVVRFPAVLKNYTFLDEQVRRGEVIKKFKNTKGFYFGPSQMLSLVEEVLASLFTMKANNITEKPNHIWACIFAGNQVSYDPRGGPIGIIPGLLGRQLETISALLPTISNKKDKISDVRVKTTVRIPVDVRKAISEDIALPVKRDFIHFPVQKEVHVHEKDQTDPGPTRLKVWR